MTWIPQRETHDRLCECGDEGLLPFTARSERGDRYTVWRHCSGTGPWRPDLGPQPEMSFDEYVERHPNWQAECAIPDARDHEFCRLTGRAIARDKGCVPFPAYNPLHPLVTKYAKGFGWIEPAPPNTETAA